MDVSSLVKETLIIFLKAKMVESLSLFLTPYFSQDLNVDISYIKLLENHLAIPLEASERNP